MYPLQREGDVFWFQSDQKLGLQCSPGLHLDPAAPTPTDPMVRYAVSFIAQKTRVGARFSSGEQVQKYLQNPKGCYPDVPDNVYKFFIPSSSDPKFGKISGTSSG